MFDWKNGNDWQPIEDAALCESYETMSDVAVDKIPYTEAFEKTYARFVILSRSLRRPQDVMNRLFYLRKNGGLPHRRGEKP